MDPLKETKHVKPDFGMQPESKDNGIAGLAQLHNSRIKTLCKFISKHNSADLLGKSKDDTLIKDVREIVIEQGLRGDGDFASDVLFSSQTQEIETLKARISHLDNLASQYKKKAEEHKEESKLQRRDIRRNKQGKQQLMKQLEEREAQVAILNSKVSQLLNMDITAFSPSISARVDKDLPSPISCRPEPIPRKRHSKFKISDDAFSFAQLRGG